MKKLFVALSLFMIVAGVYAEKFRYITQKNTSSSAYVIVMEFGKALESPDSQTIDLSTSKGRLQAESACRNIKRYYDQGLVNLMFVDYTKNSEDPDMRYIDSWQELMMYVRGER